MNAELSTSPQVTSHDLPGIGGRIGPEPEDFRVDELPAYEPSGEGEHRYVRIEKRLFTTPQAVQAVARAAGIQPREVGYAGLKDKHAVTTQWLSLPVRTPEPDTWQLPDAVRVLESSRHGNKLRTGHLRGNRFSIALDRVPADALPKAEAIARRLETRGMLNYFGGQRFGRGGENLPRALDWLRGGARRRVDALLLKLYPSVVQSHVFDLYVSLRQREGLDRVLAGEVVRLNGSSALFVVEDAAREEPRLTSGDIHLTGPMAGPKMRKASGRPLELEQAAAAAAGVDENVLETLGRFAPGARRDVLVYPEHFTVREDGAGRLRLEFELPAGSYATVLVREFTRDQPEESERAAAAPSGEEALET